MTEAQALALNTVGIITGLILWGWLVVMLFTWDERPARLTDALFPWREVRNTGGWRYEENVRTGQRRAIRIRRWQPLDVAWLNEGAGEPWVIG